MKRVISGISITCFLILISFTIVVDSTVLPEPATIFLMGSGLLGAGIFLRKRFAKTAGN